MRIISSVTAISRFMRVFSSWRISRHVAVLDVAAILAQVQRDAVRARLLGEQRGVHGIRIVDAPRLAQRRHVIDVHAERDAARLAAHDCSGGALGRIAHAGASPA